MYADYVSWHEGVFQHDNAMSDTAGIVRDWLEYYDVDFTVLPCPQIFRIWTQSRIYMTTSTGQLAPWILHIALFSNCQLNCMSHYAWKHFLAPQSYFQLDWPLSELQLGFILDIILVVVLM